MGDLAVCPFCAEKLPPAVGARCPHCGEQLGPRAPRELTGWGSPRQPMAIAVFGWLSIVLGGLGLLGGVITASMLLALGTNDPMISEMLGRRGSGYRTFNIVGMVLGTLGSVLSLVAGYGLLRMRAWGRSLAVGLSVYGLVWVLFSASFSIPEAVHEAPPGLEAFTIVTTLVVLLIAVLYHGLLLHFLRRPHVVSALEAWERERAGA